MTCKGDCIGYEIALDPWHGGELVIQLYCFEQFQELVIQLYCFEQFQEIAKQSGLKLDLGKHAADDCLCQLPAELVQRVVGDFIMKKAAEGFAVPG